MNNRFARKPLPERFCNLERLLAGMAARGLDGVVISTPLNVFYLSGFNGIAHKADEPRPYALALSRHAPDHPILVLADYYLATFLVQPSWVRDIRPFRAVMMPLDRAPQREDIDRFIPSGTKEISWLRAARNHYAFDMSSALRGALAELGLERGRIGFDDLALGQRLGLEHAVIADAYDALMFARAVKTPTEIDLLRRATALNRAAIERTVKSWEKGMRWRELNRAYHVAAVDLGGFVRDPGAMVWGHPRGTDAALTLQTGLEDFEVERGQHVMFDCHGTLDLYCWDGGKTWVVGGEPQDEGKRNLRATYFGNETGKAAKRDAGEGARALPQGEGRRSRGLGGLFPRSGAFTLGHCGDDCGLAFRGRHGGAVAHRLPRRRAQPRVAGGGGARHRARRRAVLRLGIRTATRLSVEALIWST